MLSYSSRKVPLVCQLGLEIVMFLDFWFEVTLSHGVRSHHKVFEAVK